MIGKGRSLGKDNMWIVCLFAFSLIGHVDGDCDINENEVACTEVPKERSVTCGQMADQTGW